jgi:hypothetical protein
MTDRHLDLDALCRLAMGCRVCFERLPLQPAMIDLPQPRWVGPAYWRVNQRIAVVLVNPGSGEGYNEASDRKLLEILHRYKDGRVTLDDVFDHQAHDFANWGRGRFARFFIDGLGLRLDKIAFANIAWCATAGNDYPKPMLNACFERHTRRLLEVLAPDVILLSGSRTSAFQHLIETALPRARVISMLHYAHRGSDEREQQEILRVRSILGGAGAENISRSRKEETLPVAVRETETSVPTSSDLTPSQTRAIIESLVRLGFSDQAFFLIHHMAGETLKSHTTYLGRSTTNRYLPDSRNLTVAQRLAWIRVQAEGRREESRTRDFWKQLAKEARDRFPFA